jgi:hypothetical protein
MHIDAQRDFDAQAIFFGLPDVLFPKIAQNSTKFCFDLARHVVHPGRR